MSWSKRAREREREHRSHFSAANLAAYDASERAWRRQSAKEETFWFGFLVVSVVVGYFVLRKPAAKLADSVTVASGGHVSHGSSGEW